MKEALDRLAAAANRLNQASDRLTESIEILEDQFAKFGIGVPFWYGEDQMNFERYLVCVETKGASVTGWCLGYAKIDKRWRIAVKHVKVSDDTGKVIYKSEEPVPLASAPRAMRVLTIEHFPGLISAMTTKLEAYAADVEKSKTLLV